MQTNNQLYKKISQVPVWEVVMKLSILAGFGIAASAFLLLIVKGIITMLH